MTLSLFSNDLENIPPTETTLHFAVFVFALGLKDVGSARLELTQRSTSLRTEVSRS